MIITLLIIGVILLIYFTQPHFFIFNKNYTTGRYVTIKRNTYRTDNVAINYANILFMDTDGYISPYQVTIKPRLRFGDGITPKAKDGDLNDIVLVETGTENTPEIEYDLGAMYNLNKIIIVNRQRTKLNNNELVDQRLQDTKIEVLNERKISLFEYYINDVQDIYSINTY